MTSHPNLDHLKLDLAELLTHYETARQRILDQRRGQPAAANPNGSGGGGGNTSPVERALNLGGDDETTDDDYVLTGDRAAGTIAFLDTEVDRLTQAVRNITRIVMANVPHQASQKARDSVELANDRTCEHCTKWVKPGRVELVHRIGDVAGNLKDSDGEPLTMALGAWCYRFTRTNGRLPSKAEVQRHDDGLRVRVVAS